MSRSPTDLGKRVRNPVHRIAEKAAIALMAGLLAPLTALPSLGQGLIRDAEIEDTIGEWAWPLARHAGFQKGEIRLHIVKDPKINAFVSGGKRIFLTTGLLMRAGHPGQVKGVMAHEIGHIAGGHLARLSVEIQDARAKGALGSLVGAALGAVAGRPDAVMAGLLMGTDIAERGLRKFSRVQESSADQVAVDLLDATQASSRGLLELFQILEEQELLPPNLQDPYLRTHPLTRTRIAFVRGHLARSPYSDAPALPGERAAHGRMVAKLKGFLNRPERTLREYAETDRALPARYARAVALYRTARIDEALGLIDGLAVEMPEDPYFRELRGQMLFENGRLPEARRAYEEALRLLPGQPLIQAALAQVYIELGDPELTEKAAATLETALRADPAMVFAWRLSAIAYGRTRRFGLSALSSAEHALLRGRTREAAGYARKAERLLAEGSPGRLRASDIIAHVDPSRRSGGGERKRQASEPSR